MQFNIANYFVLGDRLKTLKIARNKWCAFLFQVMLLGDSGVGKTCLLVRFKDNAFLSGSFISTVGIDFRVSLHWSEFKGAWAVHMRDDM